jgi:hypothetical protein
VTDAIPNAARSTRARPNAARFVNALPEMAVVTESYVVFSDVFQSRLDCGGWRI